MHKCFLLLQDAIRLKIPTATICILKMVLKCLEVLYTCWKAVEAIELEAWANIFPEGQKQRINIDLQYNMDQAYHVFSTRISNST